MWWTTAQVQSWMKTEKRGVSNRYFCNTHEKPDHLQQPKHWVGQWAMLSQSPTAGTSIQRPGLISQMTHWRLRWCQSSVHPWHPLLFLFSLRNRGGHTHMASKAKLEPQKTYPEKRPSKSNPQPRKGKGKKETPKKNPLRLSKASKKPVARKGRVEGNEPEVSRGPSNTGS